MLLPTKCRRHVHKAAPQLTHGPHTCCCSRDVSVQLLRSTSKPWQSVMYWVGTCGRKQGNMDRIPWLCWNLHGPLKPVGAYVVDWDTVGYCCLHGISNEHTGGRGRWLTLIVQACLKSQSEIRLILFSKNNHIHALEGPLRLHCC